MRAPRFRLSSLTVAALVAVGCTQAPSAAPGPAAGGQSAAATDASANLLAAQIADTLQACSYDGSPVRFGMGGDAPRDCRDMIEQVMAFTGLPQNFVVTEAEVPNAAAAILLDREKLPHRVIAFNPDFINAVRRQTGGNPWSAVSVMAHEAGHHLAGHTIQPGGSQPPIELEADKFSGFVLYKMGASREDALVALKSLVPDSVPAGSTHPGRSQRVAALTDGWNQACRQTGRTDCVSGAPGSAPPTGLVGDIAQSRPAPAPATRASPAATAASDRGADAAAVGPAPAAASGGATTTLPTVVVLPDPDSSAIPSKGTQFIYDEFGILDPQIVARHERQMFEHARDAGVEIVTLLVKDLKGMSAEAYAWAMLRQLRIGKLDVGNGAVLVVAPEQGQAAAVMGPGVALEMDGHDKTAQLKRWIATAWPLCRGARACGNWTDNLLGAADHIRRDTRHWDWTVRYQSLGDIQAQAAAENGKSLSPGESNVWRKIVRFGGTVVALSPTPGNKAATVIEPMLRNGRKAVHVRTDEGLTAMLYLDPRTEQLMPGGALQEGQRYVFIGREAGLSWNPKDTQAIDLLSYAQAGG